MKTDAVLNLRKSRYFWISFALLLFNVPFIPVMIGVGYNVLDIQLFSNLVLTLNILMHICFIIGFLWSDQI